MKIYIEEQTTCVFKTSSMDVNLSENVEIGGRSWRCVSAISNVGSSYFRIGNRWFISNDCKEIKETELTGIEMVIYERADMDGVDKSENYARKGHL